MFVSRFIAVTDAEVVEAAERAIFRSWRRGVDDPHSEDEDCSDGTASTADDRDSAFGWNLPEADTGLSAWDQLGEGYERDAARIGQCSMQQLEDSCP